MSGQYNSETQQYEVFSTLEGDMVPTGKPLDEAPQSDPDYCGYCKCSPCTCDGFGGGHTPTCGYCYSAYDTEGNCECDGFGNPR